MKHNTINKNILLGLCMAMLTVTACKKTGLQTEDGGPDRLFRPTISGSLQSDGNYITAAWQKVTGAVSYTVQLSRDTFKTIDQKYTIDSATITFLNLYWDKLYQLQIRANAADTTKSSKMGSLGSIKTPKFPTILNTPGISDLTDEAVRVSWATSGAAVTSIKILKGSDSSVVTTVTLTPAEVTAGYRIIAGLASSTDYIIFLYSGTAVRGWANFKTKAPLSGTIIDLRGITGVPSILADTIPDIPAGSTVLLKRGAQYDISAVVSFSKSITITSGDDLAVQSQALIYFTSNFNFAAGSVIDYVDFKDVSLKSAAYGTYYVFNNSNSATVGRVGFDGCKVEIFRGVLRLQAGTVTVSNYVINNSIVDSVKEYAVLTCGVATAKVDNVLFTNSTFYKIEKLISSTPAGSTASSVVIENCTLNETPTGGGSNYLIDYSANNVTAGIQIKTSIIGVAKQGGASMSVRGVRYNGSGSADGSSSYGTLDYLVSNNAILNLSSYSKNSTDLFTDPLNGNFKILDKNFAGKSTVGDPRWRL